MQVAQVYGFGSYFETPETAKDIDLLILHESTDERSCKFALRCKAALLKSEPRADIRILSKAEEKQTGFIATAKARLVGTIHSAEENSLKVNFLLDDCTDHT